MAATASDVTDLQQKIDQLEKIIEEKDCIIRDLQREIPGNDIKYRRLNIDGNAMKYPDPKEGEPKWTANKVRDAFLSHFENKHDHVNYKSAPVVPINDPTLLFINSGMAQFKPIFLGQVSPTSPMAGLSRAVNSQKCIRAGGKHNDLDDVGKDSYHHTFFEMLGNWSFGDYFKKEAIDMAWDLLTNVYKIPKDRLYVTYFEGDENVPRDEEAITLWKNHVSEDRILPGDAKDNFWEMGPTGPCGPCSEIHYDRIGGRNAASLVNQDDPNVIEIWNLVFMQFNRKPDGSLESLPAKHIDTGMGFERVVSVLQDKESNYDTDLFAKFFDAIKKKVGVMDPVTKTPVPYEDKYYQNDPLKINMAYRVLADHIRTLTVAISDGAVPSNEGRGYVLRRIIRRAVRFARDILHMPKHSFSSLVPVAIDSLEIIFPDLRKKERYIIETIQDEERSFERTLKKGLDHFEKESKKLRDEGILKVPGELVFKLYESMGFPKDLTELMAEERGMKIDGDGYEQCMLRHVEISKGTKKKGDNSFRVFEAKETSELEERGVEPTVHDFYNEVDVESTIMAIYDSSKEAFVDEIDIRSCDSLIGVVLNKSSMYFESGGQIGDEGSLIDNSSDSSVFKIEDVQNAKGFSIHIGYTNKEYIGSKPTLKVGDLLLCSVDYDKRDKIKKNHSATHVLNWGLRSILGSEVDQAGSLVNEEYLRFDFTSKNPTKTSDIVRLESLLKEKIEESEDVDSMVVPLAQAKSISSLRAVFGETYPDPVRVVAIGCKIQDVLDSPKDPKWENYSIELCGGTHVANSSVIKRLAIMSEEAKGKNIRRMVCLTDEKAMKAWEEGEAWYEQVQGCGNDEIKALSDKIGSAPIPISQRRSLLDLLNEKKVAQMEAEKANFNVLKQQLIDNAGKQKAQGVVIQLVDIESNATSAPKLVKAIAKGVPDVSFIVLVKSEANVSVALNITKEHLPKVDSKKLFDVLKQKFNLKGGGKPESLAGTTPETTKFSELKSEVSTFVKNVTV